MDGRIKSGSRIQVPNLLGNEKKIKFGSRVVKNTGEPLSNAGVINIQDGSKDLSGTYVVKTVIFDMDTRGSNWDVEVTADKVTED